MNEANNQGIAASPSLITYYSPSELWNPLTIAKPEPTPVKTFKIDPIEVVRRSNVKSIIHTELVKALNRLPAISEAGPWIAGGAVRRTLQNESLSDTDLDFFFYDQEQADMFELDLVQAYKASLVSKNEMNTTYILPTPSWAVSDKENFPELKIQVIRFKFFENIDEVIDSFDFTLCQFGYDGKQFTVGANSLWDTANKLIIPHKITYGASSLRRLVKYTNQGFHASNEALQSILQQVVDRPEIVQAVVKYND